MILKYRAWLKQHDVMVDDVTDMTFEEGNLEFIGRRTSNGVSLQYCADDINLMQSTGLKDKNGKEIFEGDILASETYPVNGAVEYRAKLGMWVNCLKEYSYYEYLGNVASDRKIIGNIYENPEFLEVE